MRMQNNLSLRFVFNRFRFGLHFRAFWAPFRGIGMLPKASDTQTHMHMQPHKPFTCICTYDVHIHVYSRYLLRPRHFLVGVAMMGRGFRMPTQLIKLSCLAMGLLRPIFLKRVRLDHSIQISNILLDSKWLLFAWVCCLCLRCVWFASQWIWTWPNK